MISCDTRLLIEFQAMCCLRYHDENWQHSVGINLGNCNFVLDNLSSLSPWTSNASLTNAFHPLGSLLRYRINFMNYSIMTNSFSFCVIEVYDKSQNGFIL